MKNLTLLSAVSTLAMAAFLQVGCSAAPTSDENTQSYERELGTGSGDNVGSPGDPTVNAPGLVWQAYTPQRSCEASCAPGTFQGLCCVQNTCPPAPAGKLCFSNGAGCISVPPGANTFQRFTCARY